MTDRTDGPSAMVRIRVMKRDRFTCTYCGVPGTDAELEVDHIIAVANGGSHHISNLTTACRTCNQKKGTRMLKPNKAQVSMRHPLIGMYFHTFKNGRLHYQAQVIGVDGDVVLAQMFEWLLGDPTNVQVFNKAVLYSDDCRLYADAELWRFGAEEAQRAQAYDDRVAQRIGAENRPRNLRITCGDSNP